MVQFGLQVSEGLLPRCYVGLHITPMPSTHSFISQCHRLSSHFQSVALIFVSGPFFIE